MAVVDDGACMTSNGAGSYEDTRQRHFAYLMSLMPEFLARLRWSRAEIDAEQTRALRDLVSHAAHSSPWHRERLRRLDSDRLTPAALRDIPPMTKSDLMEHWDAIVTDSRCTLAAAETHLAGLTADAYFLDQLHVIASGGSSGKRGVFVYDWYGWAASALGLMRGLNDILLSLGRPLGPFATVSAYVASHATSALGQTFSNPDRPSVRAPVSLPLAEIVAILNRAQPSLLHTYPSMLPALCEEVHSGHLHIAPALIWSTSEPLLPEVRAMVEATWSAPVANGWAASESNGGAFCCPAGAGFHIGEDLNIIEPIDEHGNPVPRGQPSAKILLTNLYNRIMPLIRYEITDEFQIAAGPCGCGSAYLKVADVHGRADDVFRYASGTTVHPLNFRSPLGKDPAIVEYQVRQTQRGAEIAIVARAAVDIDALRSTLAQRLTGLGLSAPEVILRRVDRIERQGAGKLKRFIPLPAL
ncbi:phenylacetate--CoA ligase family protein [Candidatus Binatus sp.]|uniref:phenylacetate--CoA ligase family protein n=1 Tax=Candidatus Binatus sp. TaxID=2811406 RepID=UPI003F945BAA